MTNNPTQMEKSEHALATTSRATIDPANSNGEVYIGLDGRRHIETAEGADQTWFKNASSESYSCVVSSETDVAVDDLRFEELNDIFAKQAAFWKSLLGKAPASTEDSHGTQRPQEAHRTAWKLDLHLRQIIRQIARELGACCVLVIHESKEEIPSWLRCEHPACSLPEKRLLPGATFFNVEPVTHWQSLDLAEDVEIADGELEVFRRVPASFHISQWLGRMTFCTTCMGSLCKAEGLMNTRKASGSWVVNAQHKKDSSDTNIPRISEQPSTQYGLTTNAVAPSQPAQRLQKRPSSPGHMSKKVLRRKLSTSSLHLAPAPDGPELRPESEHDAFATSCEPKPGPTMSSYKIDDFMLGFDGAYDSVSEDVVCSVQARSNLRRSVTRSMVRSMAEKAGVMITDIERSSAERSLVSATTTTRIRRASSVSPHVQIRSTPEKGKHASVLRENSSNDRRIDEEVDKSLVAAATPQVLQGCPPSPPLTPPEIEVSYLEQAQDSSIAIKHTIKPADTPLSTSTSSGSEADRDTDNHTLPARLRRDKETRQIVRNLEHDIRQEAKLNKRRHSGDSLSSPTSLLQADLDDSHTPCVEPTSPHRTHIAKYRLQYPCESIQRLDGPSARRPRRSGLTASTQTARALPSLPFKLPELWCYCRRPDDGETMIQCSGGECLYGWFHMRCLLEAETRRIKWDEEAWYCSVCTSLKHKSRGTAADKALGSLPPPSLNKIKIEMLFGLPTASAGLLHPYGLGAALAPE